MKYGDKIAYQERVNPGHKQKYSPPLRPRSAIFKSGTEYDRAKSKIDLKKESRYGSY